MKFFKKKNLLNVLYAVLIALPLFSILGRVLYTQWNQNAKDSYSGRNSVNETIQPVEDNTTMEINQVYFLSLATSTTFRNGNTGSNALWNINLISYSTDYASIDTFLSNNNESIGIQIVPNANYLILRGDDNTTQYWYYSNNNFLNMEFTLNVESNTFNFSPYLSFRNTQNYYYIDNAFDYSISQFVSENDFGKLNFFTWFSNLFLSNNSKNTLYIHFVNWYLNYTLFVSLGYILWLVLMWFVSFIRRLLEKTSTYETGGF